MSDPVRRELKVSSAKTLALIRICINKIVIKKNSDSLGAFYSDFSSDSRELKEGMSIFAAAIV
jgi:uncharacterized protein YbbK (DUF523 family)